MFKVKLNTRRYDDILWSALCAQEKPNADSQWFYGEVKKMDVYLWCKDNLSGYFEYSIDCHEAQLFLNHFDFKFDLEEDVVAFKLRWL